MLVSYKIEFALFVVFHIIVRIGQFMSYGFKK